jgi:hypothetical protein
VASGIPGLEPVLGWPGHSQLSRVGIMGEKCMEYRNNNEGK